MVHAVRSRLLRRLITLLVLCVVFLATLTFHPATAQAANPQCETGCIWWQDNVCLQTQTCCLDNLGWYCVTN